MARIRQFLGNYRVTILAWVLIFLLVYAGLCFGIDKSAVALAILIV